MTRELHRLLRTALCASLLVLPAGLFAAERREPPTPANAAAVASVDLFDAMKAKQIEVKLIPKDSTQVNIFISNKTKKPITVRLPDAYAAVPVLAQAIPGGGGGAAAAPAAGTRCNPWAAAWAAWVAAWEWAAAWVAWE